MEVDHRIKDGKWRFPYLYIARLSYWWQNRLYAIGIAWHNSFTGECTRDFNCCAIGIGKKAWWRISQKKAEAVTESEKSVLSALIDARENHKETVVVTKFVKHVVITMEADMVQRCVLCGDIISDYRHAMWPNDQPAPQGYPAGEVFVRPGNPRVTTTILSEGEIYVHCSKL